MVEFMRQSTTMRVTHAPEAHIRRDDRQQAAMSSYVSPEQRVLHPLRTMRAMVDTVLAECPPKFGRLYSAIGQPSVASVDLDPRAPGVRALDARRMRRPASTIEERGFDKVCGR